MESDPKKHRQKKQFGWATIVVSFFFISLAIDYFFLHFLFQEKMKELQKQEEGLPDKEQSAVEASMRGLLGLPKGMAASSTFADAAAPPSARRTPLKQFQKNIEECLGDRELAKSTTPTQFIRSLQKKNPPQDTHFQFENIHLRLSNGTTRSLHLIRNASHPQKNLEIQYFEFDKKGTPIQIPLSFEDTENPKPDFIEKLKKQGTPVFHQIQENKTLKNGSTLALNTLNEKVFEFQISENGKTLSCRELDCHCK